MSRFMAIQVGGDCLQRAAAGDAAAQQAFYEVAAGPVFALVRRLVRGRAPAEDVFQDCMMGLLATLGSYRGDAPLGAWVRRVTLNHCLMHLRSPWQRARRALDSIVGDGGEVAAVPDLTDERPALLPELIDLERALARLPANTRAIVWLHDAEGFTHEEIAAQFGRTTSFSKSQLSRGHALLRAELDSHDATGQAASAAQVAAQEQVP